MVHGSIKPGSRHFKWEKNSKIQENPRVLKIAPLSFIDINPQSMFF
jgi:hypothetical protein